MNREGDKPIKKGAVLLGQPLFIGMYLFSIRRYISHRSVAAKPGYSYIMGNRFR